MSHWSAGRALLVTTVLAAASSLAISPAQADSGRIQFTVLKADVVIGGSGGSGTLTFKGRRYPLSIGGLSYGFTLGITDRTIVHKGSSLELTPDRIEKTLGDQVRLWHLDGEHSRRMLKHDLDLAFATTIADGLIVIDDMLHPEYPLLLIALHEWLQAHRDVRVLCILDREDIVSAAKFVLCRTAALPKYEHDLMAAFKPFHYTLGSEWEDYFCAVLTPRPRIASIA